MSVLDPRKYQQPVLKAVRKKDFQPMLDIGAYIRDYPIEGMLTVNGVSHP